MQNGSLHERIESAIKNGKSDFEDNRYFDMIRENLRVATKILYRNVIIIMALIIAFLLNSAWINNPVNLAIIKIIDAKIISVILPVIISYYFYALCSSFGIILHLRTIHDIILEHKYPSISTNGLIYYLRPIYPFLTADPIAIGNIGNLGKSVVTRFTPILHIIYISTVVLFLSWIFFFELKNINPLPLYFYISLIISIFFLSYGSFILLRFKYMNKGRDDFSQG